ncbi:unnamed protein product [Cochlearia groenlandica]
MHRRGIQESDEEEEDETYNDVVPESPYSCEDSNISKPTPKKRRRDVAKRVVSVPIADVERSKRRGEVYPPSDSWAWRKYGQKPIKGSPYPRGYYRCSSSKGCPARKQVERNRIDPTKLIITYASDHNHPFPSASNHKSHHHKTTITTVVIKSTKKQKNLKQEEKPMGLDLSYVDPPLLLGGCYGELEWFYDASSSGSSSVIDVNLERGFSVGGEKEDESLFGDLDDLPDCASVFRRGTVVTTTTEEEQQRRCDFGAISLCDSSR